jgi:hypothetical protein
MQVACCTRPQVRPPPRGHTHAHACTSLLSLTLTRSPHPVLVCVGDALAHVEGCGLAARVIQLVQVFARVSPEQKELVLQASVMVPHLSYDSTCT